MITASFTKKIVVKQQTPMGVKESVFDTVKGAEQTFVFTASDISVFEVETHSVVDTEKRTQFKSVRSTEISPRLNDEVVA